MTLRLPVVLLASGLLALTAPAALAGTDPCAPVDGEVPLMCQSGLPQTGPAVGTDPGSLPRTGPEDVPALLAAGLVLLAGGAVLTAGTARRAG